MRRRSRKIKQPSSGHHLAKIVVQKFGTFRPATLRAYLEARRSTIGNLAGIAGADWAIDQLSTLPERVPVGWPAPYRRRKVSR